MKASCTIAHALAQNTKAGRLVVGDFLAISLPPQLYNESLFWRLAMLDPHKTAISKVQ
jgi:hypothetical protein